VACQARIEGACLLEQIELVGFDQILSRIDIRQVKQLHLANHFLGTHPGLETAGGLRQLCHIGNGRHHGWFFHHHRYQD